MSVRVMKNVWDFKLPDSIPQRQQHLAKLVLLKLADNASDDGKAFPSIDRIAHECACSYRSVSRMLNHLEDAGVIARQQRSDKGMKKNSIYWLNIKRMMQDADPFIPKSMDESNPFIDETAGQSDRTSRPKQQTISPINHHEPSINHKKETDISHPEKRTYSIEELCKEGFEHCHEMIRILRYRTENRYGEYFTGKLSLEEWQDCEMAMSSCDEFNHVEYVSWWNYKHYRSMKKIPSLPNLVCDMNGIPFEQFYDSVFLQEHDF